MEIKEVKTGKAPGAIGPYSQAVIAGGFLFVSGQIPVVPETGEVVAGSSSDQARRALINLKGVVEAAGASMNDVVRTTVYLTDLSEFASVNEVYAEFFTEPYPARASVEVSSLPKGVDVEIDCVALTET
ncbi:RidA/YER057c/UK114 superfamily protein [hydrothermal vent metagenome]|uniref:RidA/YER057c/UK114 superfamily protein n=1 Tax=hydrothermal vent metagenome TaxID=652676 RepID=A0A3B0UW22_9ZZZZ